MGGWKSEIRVPAWSGSSKSPLPSLQMVTFLLCPHLAERERERERERQRQRDRERERERERDRERERERECSGPFIPLHACMQSHFN